MSDKLDSLISTLRDALTADMQGRTHHFAPLSLNVPPDRVTLGTTGNDTLNVTPGGLDEAIVMGGAGDDDLTTTGNFIEVYGGGGDDSLTITDHRGEFYGGTGNDTLTGGDDQQNLFGGNGMDILRGANGSDSLSGGAGDDDLDGGRNSDNLNGGAGDDLIRGGRGGDDISGDQGNDDLRGGRGNDAYEIDLIDTGDKTVLDTEGGNDRIKMTDWLLSELTVLQDGDDLVISFRALDDQADPDFVDASIRITDQFAGTGRVVESLITRGGVVTDITDANALPTGQTADPTSVSLQKGTAGDDTLTGTADRDVIGGGDGADTITGSNSVDVLDGGNGADTLNGGDAGDGLYGGGGRDRLFGENGSDGLFGGTGNDRLFGGNKGDSLNGGNGNDILRGQKGTDFLDGEGGDDLLFGGSGSDILDGGTGDDTLRGGKATDQYRFDYFDWGNKTIEEGAGDGDTIILDHWVRDDITMAVDGDDLVITYSAVTSENDLTDVTSTIRVIGQFGAGATTDEQVEFLLLNGFDNVDLTNTAGSLSFWGL
ncbi:MAG: hypothetical protein Alpg2KO_19840 [Alphaproteobacteria bacterium]